MAGDGGEAGTGRAVNLSELPFFSQVHIECGPGWNDILTNLAVVVESIDTEARATQVKEKFGRLRVYYTSRDDTRLAIWAAIMLAERLSAQVCEKCGKQGSKRVIGGWIATLCDDHYAERMSFSG